MRVPKTGAIVMRTMRKRKGMRTRTRTGIWKVRHISASRDASDKAILPIIGELQLLREEAGEEATLSGRGRNRTLRGEGEKIYEHDDEDEEDEDGGHDDDAEEPNGHHNTGEDVVEEQQADEASEGEQDEEAGGYEDDEE